MRTLSRIFCTLFTSAYLLTINIDQCQTHPLMHYNVQKTSLQTLSCNLQTTALIYYGVQMFSERSVTFSLKENI